jgi:hypothetical protein
MGPDFARTVSIAAAALLLIPAGAFSGDEPSLFEGPPKPVFDAALKVVAREYFVSVKDEEAGVISFSSRENKCSILVEESRAHSHKVGKPASTLALKCHGNGVSPVLGPVTQLFPTVNRDKLVGKIYVEARQQPGWELPPCACQGDCQAFACRDGSFADSFWGCREHGGAKCRTY